MFNSLSFGLALLSDPVLHGTVADPDLAGFDPKKRALLVMERNKHRPGLRRELSAEEVLSQSAKLANVSRPEQAMVFSLAGISNILKARVSTAPRPVRGPAVRKPAVAGKFYPAEPAELARMVDGLLAEPQTANRGLPPWSHTPGCASPGGSLPACSNGSVFQRR